MGNYASHVDFKSLAKLSNYLIGNNFTLSMFQVHVPINYVFVFDFMLSDSETTLYLSEA